MADSVELFAGVPDEWGDASFRSLRVPVGLLISASRVSENTSAEVTNDSDHTQCVRIRTFGAKAWEEAVTLEPGDKAVVYEVRVAPEDRGKLIGKQGRTIRSVRSLIGAAASRRGKRVAVEVLD